MTRIKGIVAVVGLLAAGVFIGMGLAPYWIQPKPEAKAPPCEFHIPIKPELTLRNNRGEIVSETDGPEAGRYGWPTVGAPLDRKEYYIAYDCTRHDPLWSLEVIHGPLKSVKREGSFRVDLALPADCRVDAADYLGKGWDIGHLTPAEDRGVNMAATFLYSNACPQYPSFNRGLWAEIEKQVRESVANGDSAWVVTLPIFAPTKSVATIGTHGVAVPWKFAKSELLVRNGKPALLNSWLAPNEQPAAGAVPVLYGISVEDLELLAHMTLWPNLTEAEKAAIEKP